MNNEDKEKLIELVRQNECLYHTKDKNYKNSSYKLLLWEKIGAALEVPGIKAKETWRLLRDGYIRHKKTVKGQTGASAKRKYSNFTWSSQMSFLDGSLKLRSTDTNIPPPPPPSDQSSGPRHSPFDQPGPSWLYHDPEVEVDDPLETPDLPLSTESPQLLPPTNPPLMPSPLSRKRNNNKKKDSRGTEDNTERVLNYLKNKKNKEWDSVDHLFMSYSHSFKKFSIQKQTQIKLTLAKVFAEAELEEFKNNATIQAQEQSSSVIILSPSCSIISDESAAPVLVTDDHTQQQSNILVEDSPSLEPTQDVLLDLTNYNLNDSER